MEIRIQIFLRDFYRPHASLDAGSSCRCLASSHGESTCDCVGSWNRKRLDMIKILVPVDGTECALNALRHAAFLAREGGRSEVVLLNVQAPLERGRASAFHSLTALREQERRDGESALATACELLDEAGVRYSTLIGLGHTARTIVSAAEDNSCDSIVMGASLWSQIKAAVGGGLPAQVIRRASVPVTVVKAGRTAGKAIAAQGPLPRPDHSHHARVVDYLSTYRS